MEENVLIGRDRKIIEIPLATWKQHLDQFAQHIQARLGFMTEVHHQIRYFAVKELARQQKPIAPETIAEALELPLEMVQSTLDDLERNLFFLVRDEQGAVAWAYPVTIMPTPHKIRFSSGERLYGA